MCNDNSNANGAEPREAGEAMRRKRNPGQRIRRAGALLAVLLPGLLAAACGEARRGGQIDVATAPEGATVRIDGREIGPAPVSVPRLAPGVYLVSAELPDHRTVRRSVTLMQGQRRVGVDLRLEPVLGLLQVVSSPPGARVLLDGAYRGTTPLFMTDVPLGAYRMAFEASGSLPKELDVRVEDRLPQRIAVDLVADAGRLVIRSTPPGATVHLNGVERGVTPVEIPDAPSGENLVEMTLAGFEPYRERITVRAQEQREVAATLQAVPTRLSVVSIPDGARVYVANQYLGDTPLEVDDLRPGEHRVRVELRGYAPMARTVRLAEEERTVEEFRLQKNSGTLIIVSEPAGASVFLNGEEYGVTQPSEDSDLVSEALEIDLLPPGNYRVQLFRRGFTHAPRTVAIAANEVVDLHERMTRIFVVDTRVRIRIGEREIARDGMLLREFPNGDIELQLPDRTGAGGTIMRISAEDIIGRQRIRAPN